MKLRNLLYATMVACAFASCSKDEVTDPVNPNPDTEATATLEVRVKNAETKALVAGDESKINSLKLIVFDAAGTVVEAVGIIDGRAGAGESVKTASIKPGNKKVLILANVTDELVRAGTSYATIVALTQHLNKEKDGFSMNSKIYDITVKANANYMGYTAPTTVPENENYLNPTGTANGVKLFRNVAKVVLSSVQLKEGLAAGAQYKDATLTLKKVFILHAHANTNLVGEDGAEWGETNLVDAYLNGDAAEGGKTYLEWVEYMTDGEYNPVHSYISDASKYTSDEVYSQVISGTSLSVAANPFYVYENIEAKTGYRTLLVVQADFSYTGKNNAGENTTITEANRFYPLAIGHEGSLNWDASSAGDFAGLRPGVTREGVMRNLQYQVGLTIAGPGYETPFGPKPDGGDPDQPGVGGDTFLDATIEIVDFATVIQNGEIE